MSSFIRRIQRQIMPSLAVHLNERDKTRYANPPRDKFYRGRGSKLGTSNPKDKALVARLRREQKRSAAK